MATKKIAGPKARRKKKKPPFDPGDSPIMVGGGGGIGDILGRKDLLLNYVYIYFDNNWYTPKPGDPEQHWNRDDELTLLTVYDDILGTPHPEVDATKKINIPCRSSNGHDSSIKVTGKSLGVKFKLKDYDYNYVEGAYISKVPRALGDIEVSGNPNISHGPNSVIVFFNKLRRPQPLIGKLRKTLK